MRATLPHPAFIMLPGDLLAHDFPANYARVTHDNDRERYRAFVLKTLKFLALEFRKRFGDTKVLVTRGNNDEECGDNSIPAHGEFLKRHRGSAPHRRHAAAQLRTRPGQPARTLVHQDR